MASHSTKPFALSVKAVIRDDAGCVLLLQRAANSKSDPGMWEFPGGKPDAGETFDAALIREVREETGLEATIDRPLGTGEMELPQVRVVILFLAASVRGHDVRLSSEHEAAAWVPVAKLVEWPLCPSIRPLANQLGQTG
jgi:8-oxo-dGTP diphosphatase